MTKMMMIMNTEHELGQHNLSVYSLYALQLINFILACVATSMNFTLTPNVTYSAHT